MAIKRRKTVWVVSDLWHPLARITALERLTPPKPFSIRIVRGLADTVVHAWSRLEICNLSEALRDSPCRNSCRSISSQSLQWTSLCFALADAARDSRAHLLMQEIKGFTTAEETDKLLWASVVCVMMLTSVVSCIHLSLADHLVLLTYLILLIGSKLMRSYRQSKWTRCVRDMWRIVELLPLFICFFTASLSSKMYNAVRMLNNPEFRDTLSMSSQSMMFWYSSLMNSLGVTSRLWVRLRPTNSMLECPLCVTLHHAIQFQRQCLLWNTVVCLHKPMKSAQTNAVQTDTKSSWLWVWSDFLQNPRLGIIAMSSLLLRYCL